MRRSTRLDGGTRAGWVAIVLVGACCLAAPSRAEAQSLGLDGLGAGIAIMSTEITLSLGALPFLIADIVYAANGRLLPIGWAVTQLVYASLTAAAVLIISGVTAFDGTIFLVYSLAPAILSAWLIAHAIWSLVEGEPAPRPQAVLPYVAPTDGGATVGLAGTF